ncbi:hypothetical protein JCM10135_01210 [Stetteria hydrogenophila]
MLRPRLRREPKRVYRPPELEWTLNDFIDFVAITYLRGLAERLVESFNLDVALRRAGLLRHPVLYAARALLFTLASLAFAVYFTIILAFSILPPMVKAVASLSLFTVPLLVFAYYLSYPSVKANERKSNVESELPFFAAYLATMTRGGVPLLKVMERVASLRVFKAMRREALMVLRDVNMFGKDPFEALEYNALEHPSHLYRDFVLGYVTTIRIGGDVVHYLEIRTQDIFSRRMADLKLLAERMSMFMEVYITIAVVMTLVFYVFFTVSAVFPAGKFAGVAGLTLFSFVVLPTMTILLLFMVHASQPKSPITIVSPYRALVVFGIPLAIIVFPVMFFLTGAYHVFQRVDRDVIMALDLTLVSTLLALSLPPAYYHVKETLRHRGLARATAFFLRDLAEVRKTGLSPERSIIAVALERSYGPLDRVVKRLAVALTAGLDVERALRRALRGIKDWILLANMRFLSDSIIVGGGSPGTLDTLARYAYSLVDLDEELRRRLRPYIFMPYIGAILVSTSSFLVLGFTVQGIAPALGQGATMGITSGITPQDIAKVTLYLSLGSLFNSWLMGLMAGKIQDLRLSAGFLHATILTLISYVVLVMSLKTVALLT